MMPPGPVVWLGTVEANVEYSKIESSVPTKKLEGVLPIAVASAGS